MPSGRVHTLINLTALASSWAGAAANHAVFPDTPVLVTFVGSYLIGTLLITPDLDLADRPVQARNNWGLLGIIWVPFGVLSRHRGLNHTYLIGPLLRLGYLLLLAAAVYAVLSSVWPDAARWHLPAISTPLLLAAAAGYWISQALHLLADGIHPFSELHLRESK